MPAVVFSAATRTASLLVTATIALGGCALAPLGEARTPPVRISASGQATSAPDVVLAGPRLVGAEPLGRDGRGALDTVAFSGGRVSLAGWAAWEPGTDAGITVVLNRSTGSSVVSAVRLARPDVAAVAGNEGLEAPGFEVVLQLADPGPQDICVIVTGTVSGPEVLPGSSPGLCPGASRG